MEVSSSKSDVSPTPCVSQQLWGTGLGIRLDQEGGGVGGGGAVHFGALVKSHFDALVLALGTSSPYCMFNLFDLQYSMAILRFHGIWVKFNPYNGHAYPAVVAWR